jgi:hypothetical protein
VNNKNKQTLNAIYTVPTRTDIRWEDIESLIKSLNGLVQKGNGSRVRFKIGNIRATFHRPHPEPQTNKLTVKDIKDFLEAAGITPE